MQQIKLFKGVETDLATVEKDINTWLKTSKAKVIQMFGNIAPQSARIDGSAGQTLSADRSSTRGFIPSDILIAVVYEAS